MNAGRGEKSRCCLFSSLTLIINLFFLGPGLYQPQCSDNIYTLWFCLNRHEHRVQIGRKTILRGAELIAHVLRFSWPGRGASARVNHSRRLSEGDLKGSATGSSAAFVQPDAKPPQKPRRLSDCGGLSRRPYECANGIFLKCITGSFLD